MPRSVFALRRLFRSPFPLKTCIALLVLALFGGASVARAQRVKTLPPANCAATRATFTQSTPVAIPAGPGTVTSTLVVSGAGNILYDVDVTTFLRHASAADLDVTITSPDGTVVTLTTDNGGDNDDVFNGTVWDDNANPAGQVPYVSNNGMATDHAYANLTLASPLAPEEPLGAFRGRDPNGTWTITVSDDQAGNGGSLDGWSLDLTTFPAPFTAVAPETYIQSTPVAIPDGSGSVTSTIVISGAGTTLLDLDLRTALRHTSPADLDMTVTSPAGTVVTLTTDNGGSIDDVFGGTFWTDRNNPDGQVPYTTNEGLVTDYPYATPLPVSSLTPEEALSAFAGEDPNGTWTLTISDDSAGDSGTLDDWSLHPTTFVCNFADLHITKSNGVDTVALGSTTTYTIVASNAGPADVDPVTVTDPVPFDCASLSYTSTAAGGASGNTASGSGDINDTKFHMPAGSSVTYTATCIVNDEGVGVLQNIATILSDTIEVIPGNNEVIDNDLLGEFPDLSLTKTLTTAGPIETGDNVAFALTVGKAGPAAATGVVVTDTLPAGLTYVSNDCGAAFAAPTLTWNVGNLAVSGSATCHLTVTVTAAGTFVNSASVTGKEADPTSVNNASTAAVTAQGVLADVPTLGTLGLIALMAGLSAGALLVLRRKRQA